MSDLVDPAAEEGVDLTAAEYALGVLDAAQRHAAERRMSDDLAFARDVEHWSALLAPMADSIPALTPPVTLWPRIEDAVGSHDRQRRGADIVELGLRRSLRLWRAAAASAGAIAAVLLVALVLGRPTVSPRPAEPLQGQPSRPPSAELLVARLQAKPGAPSFVASLDRGAHDLVITPATVRPVAGRSPELWLIPAGGKPVALGLASFTRPIRLDAVAAVGSAGRTTLAISMEPLGGSSTGQPTGPVVATGVLARM